MSHQWDWLSWEGNVLWDLCSCICNRKGEKQNWLKSLTPPKNEHHFSLEWMAFCLTKHLNRPLEFQCWGPPELSFNQERKTNTYLNCSTLQKWKEWREWLGAAWSGRRVLKETNRTINLWKRWGARNSLQPNFQLTLLTHTSLNNNTCRK